MRELSIKAQYIKPYTITMKISDFSTELKNILDENFSPESPDIVWCTDLTYIWTYEGFIYITSIIGLYSRKIILWVLSATLESKWLNRFKILDYKHADKLVLEYIETFYNTVRIHSHCGYLSPDKYYSENTKKVC